MGRPRSKPLARGPNRPKSLAPTIRTRIVDGGAARREAIAEIRAALEAAGGRLDLAARALGVSTMTLHRAIDAAAEAGTELRAAAAKLRSATGALEARARAGAAARWRDPGDV